MPLLETRDVTKRFGTLAAVQSVTLAVEEGSLHAVIGPNGAGKTTLFNLISGHHSPSAGTIVFRGRPIHGFPPNRVARLGIGRSFQRTNLFPALSVLDNVRLGIQAQGTGNFNVFATARIPARAWHVLEDLGLAAVATAKASELSHGDQRILELAITLAADPILLLLDEPTCGMSLDETFKMMRLIERTARQRTVLLIEHNMNLVMSVSNRITVLHYGQVLADGAPQEVRQHEVVRQAYLGRRR